MCVCVCVCVCVRVCVVCAPAECYICLSELEEGDVIRVCMYACVRACVRLYVCS